MKEKSEYLKLAHSIPTKALDPKTQALLEDFGKYFQKFPSHDRIDLKVFLPRFKHWHVGMTDEQFNSYIGVLRNISEDVDEETRNGILADLMELNLGTKVANLVAQYDAGELEHSLPDLIGAELDTYKINIGAKAAQWNDTPIEELLMEDVNEDGLRWRLDSLNSHMRPLRPGDFGIIAGRPDKGKTSFLASEISYLAPQLPEDRNVVWLNNESTSGKIVKRIYQAALGKTITEMVEISQKKQLKGMYEEVMGRVDKVRVIDIHGFHVGQVEAILERSNPGLIVYDMIDNIRGFGNESRTDLQLEKMYQWARERAVKYGSVGLATSQISVEGDDKMFPTLSMLKDSKTGKQGACDFQLMIGAVNDKSFEYSRFLSAPKNKLRRDGVSGDPHTEVRFHPQTSRYEDLSLDDKSNLGVMAARASEPVDGVTTE